MHVVGSCHCGNVTYKAQVNSDKVFLCHCTDCQVLSGSAFRVVVFCREDSFQLTNNQPKTYVKTAESGRRREQVFCDQCGTQLYATSVGGEPRFFGLRVGAIQQRDDLVPSKQLWSRSAQSWICEIEQIEKLEKQ